MARLGKSRSKRGRIVQNPLSRAEARRLRQLRQRAQRDETGLFLAEGVRIVEELLRSPIVLRHAVVAPSLEDSERGRALARELGLKTTVYTTSDVEISQLSDAETPQGIVVCAEIPPRPALDAGAGTLLVLDAIQDPGNFGTLVRSAAAFGAGAVIALPGTVDPWNGKSIRSAAGTSFHIPLVSMTTPELRAWCSDNGTAVWGAAADGVDIRSLDRPGRVALVLGNEGSGLRAETAAIVDARVALRMSGPAESLNAAVAGGILLYLLSESI